MFFKKVTLFRFFGFDVRADASWLFLSVFISWSLSTHYYPSVLPDLAANTYQLMGVATLAGLMFSIIAHEAAHGVIAEYYQMPIRSITLFIFGGVAEMKGEPSHPKGELLMALAGPIMSLLLGLFFRALAEISTPFGFETLTTCLSYLGTINFLIAAFNMAPAFPLDGGRALRAIIWKVKNNLVLATRIASDLGAVFAYGLMAWGCYELMRNNDLVSGIWMTLLGLFVHASGAHAVKNIESRSLLGMEQISRFMHTHITSVPPDLTIADFVDKYVYAHYQSEYPVVDGGRLSGLLTLNSVLKLPRDKWQWLHVASLMQPISERNTLAPTSSAIAAFDLLQNGKRTSLLVADGDKLVGVVDYVDLAAYLNVTMKVDNNRPVELSR